MDNKNLVNEIIAICEELGLESNAEMTESKNTFLSAWHKKRSEAQ